jgi:Pyruvate/2-oxoacid:ferredoxin oxidoreductase delta subunit
MTTDLFYFSGNGNELEVARDLARELRNARVIPIARALVTEAESTADCVGVLFPVYMWGPPLIVARFCGKVAVKPSAYLFGVATHGGMPGAPLFVLRRLLRRRGLKLACGFGIKMPGTYTPLHGAVPEEKQRPLLAREGQRVREIAEALRARRAGIEQSGSVILNMLLSRVVYGVCAPRIPGMDKAFWVDEKCNGCGLCARVCPVRNVEMTDGKPRWLGHCEQCMACLQWCPQEAIQAGKRTEGRRRYRHPEVNATDLTLFGG